MGLWAACLLVFLLIGLPVFAGTITGQIQTATGGAVANGTFTFVLSQPAVLSGTGSVTTSAVSCYSSNSGLIVGLPDPITPPVVSASTSGGTLAGGTYYVKISYYNGSAESAASPEQVVVLSSIGSLFINAPTLQPTTATGYKLYIGTTSGGETFQNPAIVGWVQSSVVAAISTGGATPLTTNTSSCSLTFSDQLIPTGTYYTVSLTNKNGSPIAGFPQTWCTYGGAAGTINVSNGAPTGNCSTNGVFYPTPIFSTPQNNAAQSIAGPMTFNGAANALFGSTTICNMNGVLVLNPGCFAGGDIGAQANAAYAALPATGGTIMVPTGAYTYSTPILFNTLTKPCSFTGTPNTLLTFVGSGNAITLDWGWHNADPQNQTPSPGVYALQLFANTLGVGIGIEMNGPNGVSHATVSYVKVYGFATGIDFASQAAVSFVDSILYSAIEANTIGINFANNNVENMQVMNSTIFDNTTGVVFASTADGGDYNLSFNSFDYNVTGITTNSAAQLALKITLRDNHYEFGTGGSGELNHFVFAGGTIQILGGLLVDQGSGSPAQLIAASGATTALTIRDLIAHKAGGAATYLATLTSSATSFFENVVLFGDITNLAQLSGARPSIQLQAAGPQIISNIANVFGAIQFFSTTPSGTCAANTLAINGGGTTNNTTLYICNPTVGASTWTALNIP